MRRKIWLIVVVLLFLGWQWWSRQEQAGVSAGAPAAANTPADAAIGNAADLPPEARDTLRLIAAGGPFPYERDGMVFGNFEHRLPARPRGYYHEYTVATPGAHNRGARRIIAGGQPPDEFWYTGDHYESFRRLEGQP